MAYLVLRANGNFTTAATWGVANAASVLDSEAANTSPTTSFAASTTFTPGAVTIDAILVKLAVSPFIASGTITVALDQAGSTVTGTSVTTNIGNLPTCATATNEGGWYAFAFASSVLLSAATAYSVKVQVSAGASAVKLYTSATANDWARMLRTTTTQAPANGDTLIAVGQDAAGSASSYTITMDNADAGASTFAGFAICYNATVNWSVTASINYYLKLSGTTTLPGVITYYGGTLILGTSGSPMPSSSTAVLEFACASDGQYGLIVRKNGTLTTYGAVKIVGTKLTSDVAISATTLNVVDTTGWATSDQIVIASTTRLTTDTDLTTVSTIPGSTSVTVPAITHAHSGTVLQGAYGQAEVLNLTRNIKIRSSSSSFDAYIAINAGATCNLNNTEMYNLGFDAANKRGIEWASSNTGTISGCSIHDTRAWGLYITSTAGSFTVSNTAFYNLNTTASATTSGVEILSAGITITGCWFGTISLGASSLRGIDFQAGPTFTNNSVFGVSQASGAAIGYTNLTSIGTFTGNIIHSCAGFGLWLHIANLSGTVGTSGIWRCGSFGVNCDTAMGDMVLDTVTLFGNTTSNISITGVPTWGTFALRSCVIDGGTTLVCAQGINHNGASVLRMFDTTIGVNSQHTSQGMTLSTISRVIAYRCTFSDTTKFAFGVQSSAAVSSHKEAGSSTAFINYYKVGTITAVTATRHATSGYAWQLTPTSSTLKLNFPGPGIFDCFQIAALAGSTINISVWMQKDASYNGNAPRIIMRGGIIAGVGSAGTDVIATSSLASSGTWYQVSLPTATPTETGQIELYIDCDGTAGNIFIDDFTLS